MNTEKNSEREFYAAVSAIARFIEKADARAGRGDGGKDAETEIIKHNINMKIRKEAENGNHS